MRKTIARRAALGTGVLVVGAVTLFAAIQQRDMVGRAPAVQAPVPPPSLVEAAPAAAPDAPPGEAVSAAVSPAEVLPPPDGLATPPAEVPPPAAPLPASPAATDPAPTDPAATTAHPDPSAEVLVLGERVYREQRCATCHSIAGVGSPRSPLDGVGNRLTAAEIRIWIVDPQAARPGIRKPAYDQLPTEQVEALVAFIQSLR
jgi:mono/diheme cytochrome c family protein